MRKNPDQITNPTEALKQTIVNTFSNEHKDPIKSIDVEEKIELERREAYIEPKTRDFLRILLQYEDSAEITPTYSPGIGFIYQMVDHTSNDEINTIPKDFLMNLARLDILKKSFYDSIASCPNCGSIILTFHNRCPKCKSHNIDKTSLTEHISCGHIDQMDKYLKNRCPKCSEELIEGKYRSMGRWYICQKCGDRFENPEFDLICHNCNTYFSIKEATIRMIPKFSMNLQRKREIRQNIASLEEIRVHLESLGFKIEIPGLAIGQKSGMQHHFSLIGKKQINGQEILVALDHATSESEVQVSPLILYIYKTSEIKVDIPIFIAIPNLNDTAKKIAQGHNIIVVEGLNDKIDALENIKKEIEDFLTEINKKVNIATTEIPKKKLEKSLFGKIREITTKTKT